MIDAAEAEKLASEILPRSVANRARPMSDAAEAQKLDAATEREKQLVAAAVLAERKRAQAADDLEAVPPWAKQLSDALQALDDDAGQKGLPHFTQTFDIEMSSVLHGATSCMPDGLTRSMEEEFKNNDGGEWAAEYNYVVYEPAVEQMMTYNALAPVQARDEGRQGWRLADFAAQPVCQRAKLSQAEVAAVRLYTCPWFSPVNAALRARDPALIQKWATTISVITSALLKLSELSPINRILYTSWPAYFACPPWRKSRPDASATIVVKQFLSTSPRADVVAAYNGNKFREGVFCVIEPSFGARGADISCLSQYPSEDEYAFPPCTALGIIASHKMTELPKTLLLARPSLTSMRHYTEGLKYPWSSPNDPLSSEQYDQVLAAEVEAKAKEKMREVGEEGKFAVDVKSLLMGEPKTAALGLEVFMGSAPDAAGSADRIDAIVAEFVTYDHAKTLDEKPFEALVPWVHYVKDGAAEEKQMDRSDPFCKWGDLDTGHGGMKLDDFATKGMEMAHLRRDQVFALRLYTCTPVSFALNAPLRAYKRDAKGEVVKPVAIEAPHPFPLTISTIQEAVKQLRAADEALQQKGEESGPKREEEVNLWRGVKNMAVPKEFLLQGGVETGAMSTSRELKTALFYSHSDCSVIFKIVTRSFMERGADVAWLSAFPGEKEVLFPPLTYLSPTGRTQKVGDRFTIVEVTPRL